jgi:hypothetical protein
MNWFRPLSGLLLALLMAVTSVTMAVARGQDRMGDTVEICGGFGQVFVTLDQNGQPMRPGHPCPDCLTGITALDLPGPTAAAARPQSVARVTFAPLSIIAGSLAVPKATARGPPSLI